LHIIEKRIKLNKKCKRLIMLREENGKIIFDGWVKNIRDIGKIIFLVLRDKEGEYQAVIKDQELLKIVRELRNESVIHLEGRKQEKEGGGTEILTDKIEVYTLAEQPIPLNINENVVSGIDKEVRYRFLSLRKPSVAAVFKIESTVNNALLEFFEKEGFYSIHTSKIVATGTEGGAEMFPVKYFDKTAYLAQSPQFYKQMMMAGGFEKVVEIAPAFRAEPSRDTRHLCEFISVDIEVSFVKTYEDIMQILERAIRYTIEQVIQKNKKELEILKVNLTPPEIPFPRITMKKAKEILEREYGVKYQEDEELDNKGEKLLGEYIKKTTGNDFVFLTEFPWKVAQFYHKRIEDVTDRADLIYKGMEISTGSIREHRYDVLLQQAKEKGLNIENLQFYLEFFKYGIPPHGGAAVGLERFVKQMLNLENIQEAVLLPRTPDHLVP
jgi:aspartyl-tRNA synthetase